MSTTSKKNQVVSVVNVWDIDCCDSNSNVQLIL
jgi:hypothetical protein